MTTIARGGKSRRHAKPRVVTPKIPARPNPDRLLDDVKSRHPSARPATRKQRRRGRKLLTEVRRSEAKTAAPAQGLPVQFFVVAGVMVLLTMIGLVMVLSASSVAAVNNGRSSWAYFERQLVWAGLGLAAMFLFMRVSYRVWQRLIPAILAVSFFLMMIVLIPGVGREVGGARAWINLGSFGFQPSELMKLALLLYTADLLARRHDQMHDTSRTLKPVLLVLGAASILVLLQRDLGSGIVMGAVVVGVMFFAGMPLVPLGAATGLMASVATIFVVSTPYRRARWGAFLHLAQQRDHQGYQVFQSLVGIASGGLTGAGIGAGKSKWGFLPLAHTDFIFAIIGEELGMFGVVVVCGLFIALGYAGVYVAMHAKDRFAMLLAGGVTAWLLVQALINILGVLGMMPLTGLTLPFVSFGGTSLLITMSAAGLLLNVARSDR
jgi:cell division protein FtsW